MNTSRILIATSLFLLGVSQLPSQASAMGRASKGDLGFRYDLDRALCEKRGVEGRNPGFPGECGELSGATIDSISALPSPLSFRGISVNDSILSGAQGKGGDLRGARFTHSSLARADLSGADLRAALFRDVSFSGANLEDADLRGADLRATRLKATKLARAKFDGATSLPFDCHEAIARGMVWSSPDLYGCDGKAPQPAHLSVPFRQKYPKLVVLERPDAHEWVVYGTEGVRVTPRWADLSDEEAASIKCSALLDECLKDPTRPHARYELTWLPHPFLDTGMELYHAPLPMLQKLRRIRVSSPFALMDLDRGGDRIRKLNPELEADLAKEAPGNSVRYRSILDDAKETVLDPHWVDAQASHAWANCGQDMMCFMEYEYTPNEQEDEYFAEQWIQSQVRLAPEATFSLKLKLFDSVRSAMGGNLEVVVPVEAMNLTTVDNSSLRRRRR